MSNEDLAARIAKTLIVVYAAPSNREEGAAAAIRALAARSVALGISRAAVDRRMDCWRRRLPGVLWPLATVEDAIDDLGVTMRRPARWGASRLTVLLREQWNVVLAVGGLLTAIVAYIIGLGYQRYYDALGLDLQDVGIGPAEVLARSAFGTVLRIATATVYLTVMLAPLIAAGIPLWERRGDRRLPGRAKALAVPHASFEGACLLIASAVFAAYCAKPQRLSLTPGTSQQRGADLSGQTGRATH